MVKSGKVTLKHSAVFLISLNIYNIFYLNDYRNDPKLINGYFSKENNRIASHDSDLEDHE